MNHFLIAEVHAAIGSQTDVCGQTFDHDLVQRSTRSGTL